MTAVTTRLRARNQLTLPAAIVQAAGLDVGATLVVSSIRVTGMSSCSAGFGLPTQAC
jgi:hypothetical protein